MKSIYQTYNRVLLKAALLLSFTIAIISAKAQYTLSNGSGYIQNPTGVVTEIIKKTGITNLSDIGLLTSSEHVTIHNYVDGFGRPLESIAAAASPNGKDLINFHVYDVFGRVSKKYLSFEATTTAGIYQDKDQTGAPGLETHQASFYSGTAKVASDSYPFAETQFEQSPMQRVLTQGNVGNGFQLTQHDRDFLYRTNDATDAVRKWDPDGTSTSTYSANDLSVVEASDENGVKTIVFTDKMGRTILKRQQADETINSTSYPWFDTYYVYDLSGNVAYVVPPKAVAKLAGIGTWTLNLYTQDLMYSYVYNSKNQVIQKKAPTAQHVYIIYDPLGRVALVQDGNLRTGKNWFYRKYDSQNRIIIEGVYHDETRIYPADMQTYVDGLYGTYYYEARTTGTSSGYTNNCFPTVNDPSSTSPEERLYCYYDDYDFDNNGSADYSYTSQSLTGEGTATDKTLGLMTGMKKKVLGTSNWTTSYTFYDKFYQPIQVRSSNHLKPTTYTDLMTNVRDFAGRLTITKEYHSITSSEGGAITVKKTFSYDKMDRLQNVNQSINSGSDVMIAKYEYNALGQLIDKKLHSTNSGSTFLQSVDLRYNIRGQVTSINNATLTDDHTTANMNDETNDLWGMEILYDQTDASLGNTANYTGLISAIKWKASISGGNNDRRAYLFTYDKLSRMTTANYKAYNTGSSNWTKDADGFKEAATYDWNGNLLTMKRKAVISGSVTDIDDLTYSYSSSNENEKVASIADASSNSYGFKNLYNSSTAYDYDADGNLIRDYEKGLELQFNENSKLKKVIKTGAQYVEYGYDDGGIRLWKKTSNSSGTTIVNDDEYIGSFVYTNGTLSYFATPEGRVRYNGSSFAYEYFITDPQGNIRVSFEDNGSGVAVARQENSYYPFGMIMPGSYTPTDPNNKLYNAGSDWQSEIDIETYSTFFREYDPALGRFLSVDPMADNTFRISVYSYSYNNPINFNDPEGNVAEYTDINGNKWHHPTVLTGTGMENMVWDELNGWSYGFDGWGSWATSGGGGEFASNIKTMIDFANGKYDDNTDVGALIKHYMQMGWSLYELSLGRNQKCEFGLNLKYDSGNNTEIIDTDLGIVVTGFAQGTHWVKLAEPSFPSGMDNELVEAFKKTLEGGGLALDITKNGLTAAQEFANKFSGKSYLVKDIGEYSLFKFGKAGNFTVENLGTAGAVISIGFTLIDISDKGLTWENGTDLLMGVVGLIPGVGWVISGAYFIGNGIVKKETGRSIGDFLGDSFKSNAKHPGSGGWGPVILPLSFY